MLVERALREWNDEQAADDFKYCRESPGLRVPVLLERVHADLAVRSNVRVKNLSEKVAFWRLSWKLGIDLE